MKRQILSSEHGPTDRWFDLDRATSLGKWRHGSELLRSAGGAWILYSWSAVQGERDLYESITSEAATEWLIAGGHDLPESLTAVAAKSEI